MDFFLLLVFLSFLASRLPGTRIYQQIRKNNATDIHSSTADIETEWNALAHFHHFIFTHNGINSNCLLFMCAILYLYHFQCFLLCICRDLRSEFTLYAHVIWLLAKELNLPSQTSWRWWRYVKYKHRLHRIKPSKWLIVWCSIFTRKTSCGQLYN